MRVADLEFDGAHLPGYADPVGDTPAALTPTEVADYTDHTVTMTLTDLTYNAEDATLRVALGTSPEFNPEYDVYECEYIVDIENGVASVPSMAISPEWNSFLLNGVAMYVRFELVVNNHILRTEPDVVTVGNFEPTSALSQHIFDTAEFIHGSVTATATSTTLDADTYTLTNITATGVISTDTIELEDDTDDIHPNMLNTSNTRTLKGKLNADTLKKSEASETTGEPDEPEELDEPEECEPYETPTDGGLCELIPAPYKAKVVTKRGRKSGKKSITTVDMSAYFSGTGDGTDFGITFDYDPNIQKAMDVTMYGTFTNGEVEIPVKWTIHKDEIMLVQLPMADSSAACFLGVPYSTGSSTMRNNTSVQFGQSGSVETMMTNPGLILNNTILAINRQGTSSYILYDAFKENTINDVYVVSTLSCADTIGSTLGNTGKIYERFRYTPSTAANGYAYPVYLTNKMTSAAFMVSLSHKIYDNNTGIAPIHTDSAEITTISIPYEGTVTVKWARATGTRTSIALTPANAVINKMIIGIPSTQPTVTLPAYTPGGPIDSISSTNLLNNGAFIANITELSALSDSDTYVDTTGTFVQADCVTDMGMSVEYLYTPDADHRAYAHVTTTGNTDPTANGYQINYSGNKMISTAATYTSTGGTVQVGTVGLFYIHTHSNIYKPIFTIPAGTP